MATKSELRHARILIKQFNLISQVKADLKGLRADIEHLLKERRDQKVELRRLMRQRKQARYHLRWMVSTAKVKEEQSGRQGKYSWFEARANAALDALSDKPRK